MNEKTTAKEKYVIKYQKCSDILITEIEAETIVQARYIFYLTHKDASDILDIKIKES